MKTLKDIKALLRRILCSDAPTEHIKEFQSSVWDAQIADLLPPEEELLSTLAYDLDFYVHDPVLRDEDPAYYGSKRLSMEIKTVLEKLT